MKVKKALIPAAGLGTRFLPATKSVPKELLPIVDTPILVYIVEEIIAAGIEDIIFVAGRGKTAIDDFFDKSYELEDKLGKQNKLHFLERVLKLRECANFIAIRQGEALGLGHAVFCGQPIIGKEAFAVLLGDEIMVGPSVTGTLAETFEDTQLSTVAIMEVAPSEVEKYGIVKASKRDDGVFQVQAVVEKPKKEKAPSQWALPGRYVFSSEIFDCIKNTRPGQNGEIQLADAMDLLAQKNKLLAKTFEAKRYDAGDKFGFLQANIEMGLQHPELKDQLKKYILEIAKNL